MGSWNHNRVDPGERRCYSRCDCVASTKSIMERAVQFLYPVELSCDSVVEQTKLVELNPEPPEFRAKSKRDAAAAAELRIKELVQEDNVDT